MGLIAINKFLLNIAPNFDMIVVMEVIYKLREENINLFNAVINLINKTSDDPAIIEPCGHAIYIGKKG